MALIDSTDALLYTNRQDINTPSTAAWQQVNATNNNTACQQAAPSLLTRLRPKLLLSDCPQLGAPVNQCHQHWPACGSVTAVIEPTSIMSKQLCIQIPTQGHSSVTCQTTLWFNSQYIHTKDKGDIDITMQLYQLYICCFPYTFPYLLSLLCRGSWTLPNVQRTRWLPTTLIGSWKSTWLCKSKAPFTPICICNICS